MIRIKALDSESRLETFKHIFLNGDFESSFPDYRLKTNTRKTKANSLFYSGLNNFIHAGIEYPHDSYHSSKSLSLTEVIASNSAS